MTKLQETILRTLAYADIFDYPLITSEIHKFLIAQRKSSLAEVQKTLKQMSGDLKLIRSDEGFFFLPGRKKVVSIRKKRAAWSQKKLKRAEKIARWFRLLPWVKMVAVTGALAMKNSDTDDDIDLLIATAKDRLWLSRGLIVTVLRFLGLYRQPNKVKDTICLNMLLDENHLKIPKEEQDLFSAHEVCQLKLLWDKNSLYKKFIRRNQWVTDFLPNWKT